MAERGLRGGDDWLQQYDRTVRGIPSGTRRRLTATILDAIRGSQLTIARAGKGTAQRHRLRLRKGKGTPISWRTTMHGTKGVPSEEQYHEAVKES